MTEPRCGGCTWWGPTLFYVRQTFDWGTCAINGAQEEDEKGPTVVVITTEVTHLNHTCEHYHPVEATRG